MPLTTCAIPLRTFLIESAPAVAERVAKLEAKGVITGYEAKVDMAKVGLPIQCVIELRLASHGNQQTYDELVKIPELTQCHRVTGDPCVIMQAAVGSMPELENLINRVAQFGFSKTSIVLSTAVERRMPLGHLNGHGKAEKAALKNRADASELR